MAVLDIVLHPDPILREQCVEVKEITPVIRQLLDAMAATMYDAPGVGLAAPQVGSLHRLIVADVGDDDETGKKAQLYKLVNPVITLKEGQLDSEEGCLSLPDIRETVKRYSRVVVEALDENGKPITVDAEGFLAVCLQHEIDHLNGVLFIDYLSKLKKTLVLAKLRKQIR